MSLNLKEIKSRLRTMRWQLPGEQRPVNLWGGQGKAIMSDALLEKMVNQALIEWATETRIDREVWSYDQTTTLGQLLQKDKRKYNLPSDLLVATEARVNYNDSTNFLGYQLIMVSEPFIDSCLSPRCGVASFAGSGAQEYTYRDYVLGGTTTFPLTVTYASLGADANGNTPPTTFTNAPNFKSIFAQADVDVFVKNVGVSDFQVDIGAFSSADLPFNINFTFEAVAGTLLQSIQPEKGLPQRMFVWQDELWLDPIPDSAYTFRLYGYHLPSALASGTDTPSALDIYHESILLKAKVLVARELGVLDYARIETQYAGMVAQAMKLDAMRHFDAGFVDIMNGNSYYEEC